MKMQRRGEVEKLCEIMKTETCEVARL